MPYEGNALPFDEAAPSRMRMSIDGVAVTCPVCGEDDELRDSVRGRVWCDRCTEGFDPIGDAVAQVADLADRRARLADEVVDLWTLLYGHQDAAALAGGAA